VRCVPVAAHAQHYAPKRGRYRIFQFAVLRENGYRFIFATHHTFGSHLLKTSATGTQQTRYTLHVYDVCGRLPIKTCVKAGTPGLTTPLAA